MPISGAQRLVGYDKNSSIEGSNVALLRNCERSIIIGPERYTLPRSQVGTWQTTTHQIRQSAVFYSTDDLPSGLTQVRQHFGEMDCSEIIDVLHRVVQKDAAPATPRKREIDRQEKR
jgi:hypothetical protein